MSLRLIFFVKNNCAPCAEKKPLMEAIAAEAGIPTQFVNLSTDPSDHAALQSWGVRAVPTIVLIRDTTQRVAGWTNTFINKDAVLRVIERHKDTGEEDAG